MTKVWSMMVAVFLVAGCAGSSAIPDNIPPAPPARKGEPVTAPAAATEEEAPADDGFGSSAFDDAPALEAPADDGAGEPEASDEDEDSAEDEAAEDEAAEGESPETAS